MVDDFRDPGIDAHFCAHKTRRKCCVECSAVNTYPMKRCLDDCVFLSVRAGAFLELCSGLNRPFRACPTASATAFVAVLGSARGSVVSGRNKPLVLNNNCRNLACAAVAAFGDHVRDVHEIGVPRWASGLFWHMVDIVRKNENQSKFDMDF